MKKGFVIVRIWEGLGNQLFQYAYARSLQEKEGYKVYLECRRVYRKSFVKEDLSVERKCKLHHFNISLKAINLQERAEWAFMEQSTLFNKIQFQFASHRIGKYHFATDFTDQGDHFQFHPELYSFRKPTYVMGHFLNKKYFEDIRPILLKELRLKVPPRITDTLRQLLMNENTISVHIRRTDFISRGYCISTDKYYEDAIAYMKDHIENPKFLFFSDDMDWVRKRYGKENDEEYFFVSNGILTDYEELALMYQCKHNIMANSTFSFWGAWLNDNPDKIVIIPRAYASTFASDKWIKI